MQNCIQMEENISRKLVMRYSNLQLLFLHPEKTEVNGRFADRDVNGYNRSKLTSH